MILKLDAKRRLTLPAQWAGNWEPGDSFEADYDAEENTVTFRKLARERNWLSVLKECPVSMDDLPPRSAEVFRSKL